MNDTQGVRRSALLREAVVFQLKLVADGLRDFVLVPVSFIAAIAGLLRGGDEVDREFRQVIELGRQSEQWINLFGNHQPATSDGPEASLDSLLHRAEEVVREQTRKGGISESAARSIGRAIRAAQQTAQRKQSAPPEGKDLES